MNQADKIIIYSLLKITANSAHEATFWQM